MVQKVCEICDDPLPMDANGSICDDCQHGIDIEIQAANVAAESEAQCETPASVVGPLSSAMPTETAPEAVQDANPSANSVASSAIDDLGLDDLGWGSTPSPKPSAPITPQSSSIETSPEAPAPSPAQEGINKAIIEAKATEHRENTCEACGYIQKELHPFKTPTREPMLLCDKCFADEVALANPQPDAAMQGKIVHPDEAERDEIVKMDEEDRILYNEESMINAAVPIEQVHARIEMLERRLQRAKLQLKASKRTLTVRIDGLDKKRKDEELKKMSENLAKRRARTQGTADGGAKTPKAKTPKRTKAEVFRQNMLESGFSEEWIAAQIKKAGLE